MGYSLVELLVAMGLALSIMASALMMLNGLPRAFSAEGERADMQQRLRVAVEALSRDLAAAGAGAAQGIDAGTLGASVPAVLPFRQGATGADPAGAFRPSVVTIMSVPSPIAAQTTLRQPLPARSGPAVINLAAGCPASDLACGFAAGTDVLVYDGTGAYETFRIDLAPSATWQLRHTMSDTSQTFPPGAHVVAARSRTYYLEVDPAADTVRLMRYDGLGSAAPVLDHVVGLTFEYFGEGQPPRLVRPVTDPVGPWTTYGPKPPPIGVGASAYPAGENCVFQVDATTGLHTPRLTVLGGSSPALVALTPAQLTDGPWCPDAASPHRYDADLLRIRKVAVQVRLEAAASAMRGPAGVLFTRGGTARASDWLPDLRIRFDVAPRNLNVGR
jgi:hypothetical protein